MHFEIADFHTNIKIMQYIMDHYFKQQSAADKCTLACDKNLINRRNVVTDVKKRVSAVKQFLKIELEARIGAAAMKVLDMDDINDTPSTLKSVGNTRTKKLEYINDISSKIVDEFIKQSSLAKITENQEVKINERYKCKYIGCKKTFLNIGKAKFNHEALDHGVNSKSENQVKRKLKDDVFCYNKGLLEILMLWHNFNDAVSEGDGERLIRCWKFLLPYFQHDGAHSRKYALEGLYLLAQINCLLSEQEAHRLIWNRSSKLKNGLGGNIPIDLTLEHCIRIIKLIRRKLGPNAQNKKIMDRYCKALEFNKELMHNFDNTNLIIRKSGIHIQKCITDSQGIV